MNTQTIIDHLLMPQVDNLSVREAAVKLITSLENENRELRRDKERLDWIEENANDTKGLLVAGICYWSVTKGKERLSEGDDLRDAIDEAIDKSLTKAEGK